MDILQASIKEKLWHSMRRDLARFMPSILSTELLMCPCCGRLLPQKLFSLEHIVPQQALADDPSHVKNNPETPINVRSGNILLCAKPLKQKANIYGNGCNGWKGKWFDSCIRETLNGNLLRTRQRKVGGHHIIAMLSAAYLALFLNYGYSVVLMRSGLLMRQQFFSPRRFDQNLPTMCQLIMSGDPIPYDPNDIDIWKRPFSFNIDMTRGICHVGFKHTVMMLPLSYDPSLVQAGNLLIVPAKYELRPRFDVFFE